ncbi:MAG: cyclic nucleotide-binding domain-containing protein [Planctomycetota bacterium]
MIGHDQLCDYSLFGGLAAAELEFVEALMQREHYPSAYDIIREGEAGHRIYFLLEGSAAVLVRCAGPDGELEAVATLHAGQTFGEMEILDTQPRTATVRSLSEVTCLTLSSHDLYAIKHWRLETFTIIIMNLARDVSRRLRRMDRRYLAALHHEIGKEQPA